MLSSVLALVLVVGAAQIVQADGPHAVAAKKCKHKKHRKCKKPAPLTGVPAPTVTTPGDTTSSTDTTPPVVQYPLTVSSGAGGSVASFPAGINCPTDCTENYNTGQVVNLTPQPDFDFLFNGWGGDCSADPCSVTMNGPRSVSASFIAGHSLTLTLSSNAAFADHGGTVISTPSGINCTRTNGSNSGSCFATYTNNAMVTLTITPDHAFEIYNWGGACTGTSFSSTTCNLTMSADRTVTIEFSET